MRDLRQYARQTQTRLILGGLLILLVFGDGLIWVVYGRQAAFLGILCIGAGLTPIAIILFFFWILDRIVNHDNSND